MPHAALPSLSLSPGPLARAIKAHRAAADHAAAGLWRRDASVWSRNASVQEKIAQRLGWLVSPALMTQSLGRLSECGTSLRRDGFTDGVLLGMGGSSLAPEVLRAILGVRPGWLRLQVLDSTDPAAVRAISTPLEHTLFVLASKSGTTLEPNALAAYFRRAAEDAGVANWSDHFVAITDDGTALASRARDERFRDVFINPSDIGGRYSALSFFGLVPAALMGHDVELLLAGGTAMLEQPQSAVTLGLAMGAAARSGRDKLTLLLPPSLEPFGLWIEQLVAESTGKHGAGIVPIVGEEPGSPDTYGDDRLFVRLCLHGDRREPDRDSLVRALEATAPVVSIVLPDLTSLGTEFVRWEVATAVAGALLGINPFDEPNVQQAKDATSTLLGHYKSHGQLPLAPPDRAVAGGVSLTLTGAARDQLRGRDAGAVLTLLGPGDYLAILAYLGPDAALAGALARFRTTVGRLTRSATMLEYGPRYLHSTGQLHKGGPNTGVFVLVTADPAVDVDIPGEVFSFGTLELAQALGDFASLDAALRRAVHVRLPSPDARSLSDVLALLVEPLLR